MRPCLAVVARKLSAANDLGAHAAMAAAAARKHQLVAGAGPRLCFTQYECAGCTGDKAGKARVEVSSGCSWRIAAQQHQLSSILHKL